MAIKTAVPRRIGMIERIVMDIEIPDRPVFVAHRVGLEELSPLTRPDQGPGIFLGVTLACCAFSPSQVTLPD